MAIHGRDSSFWTSVPNNTVFLDKNYSAVLAALAVEQGIVGRTSNPDDVDRFASHDGEDYQTLLEMAQRTTWDRTRKHLRQLLIAHRNVVCIIPRKSNFGPDFVTRVVIWKLQELGLIDGVIEEETFRLFRTGFPVETWKLYARKLEVIESALDELPLVTALVTEYFFPKRTPFFPRDPGRIELVRSFDHEHLSVGMTSFFMLYMAAVEIHLIDWWKNKLAGYPDKAEVSQSEVHWINNDDGFASFLRSGPPRLETDWGKQLIDFLGSRPSELELAKEWLATVDWSPPFSNSDLASFIDEFGTLIQGYADADGLKFLTAEELYFFRKPTERFRRKREGEPKKFAQPSMVGAGVCVGPDWEVPVHETDLASLIDLRVSDGFDLIQTGVEEIFQQLSNGKSVDAAIVKDAVQTVRLHSSKDGSRLGRFINYMALPSVAIDTLVQMPITGLLLGSISTVSQASEDIGRAGTWNISVSPNQAQDQDV